jgi:hypothetical protein
MARRPCDRAHADFRTAGASESPDFTVEAVNAAIESRNGQRLRVLFSKEEQPALVFTPVHGAWDWSATSKLVIPVENPGDEPLSLTLRIAASLKNSSITHDLGVFSRKFADTYFRTVAEALHRHDPDHLYLGSRFAWQTSEAVEACARWCDVVSFNRYVRSIADDPEEWARFHRLGKPP